jgi:hypothetical protein
LVALPGAMKEDEDEEDEKENDFRKKMSKM